MVLRAVADSYQFLPVGVMPNFPALVQGGIAAAGSMFFAATIIMLPLTAFLLAINLVIGVITRSAPQLKPFFIRLSHQHAWHFRLTIFVG